MLTFLAKSDTKFSHVLKTIMLHRFRVLSMRVHLRTCCYVNNAPNSKWKEKISEKDVRLITKLITFPFENFGDENKRNEVDNKQDYIKRARKATVT